jgi:hypothetical protein
MGRREELLRAEAEGWEELNALLSRAPAAALERPDLNPEGWSVRDLMWHVAFWCADAAGVFERMRAGPFDASVEPGGSQAIDRINDAQLERSRAMTMHDVHVAWFDARGAMLDRFGELEELTADADQWLDETGPLHYAEHLPELLVWLERTSR